MATIPPGEHWDVMLRSRTTGATITSIVESHDITQEVGYLTTTLWVGMREYRVEVPRFRMGDTAVIKATGRVAKVASAALDSVTVDIYSGDGKSALRGLTYHPDALLTLGELNDYIIGDDRED